MTPAADGFRMPAEWEPHARTWMAFPTDNPTFDGEDALHEARQAWAAVANTIARYEPVVMLANTGESADARYYLDVGIKVLERPLDDAWMRDIGPTFLVDGKGGLAAADWVFNGWGAQSWARWELDAQVGAAVTDFAGAVTYRSRMVNEGGGIHVDGEGTVLLTETVQLDPERNPGWTKADVERELRDFLGVRRCVWLPRGLTKDYGMYGTRGHIDIVAAFVRPGVVVAHQQPDPAHPDHEVCRENIAVLRKEGFEVVEVLAPTVTEVDGAPVDYSYINHYLANGAVVLCAFDDPRDQEAADLFGKLFPNRTVELVDAREIFAGGGGIHCITQQQPEVSRPGHAR
ncbi:agmatine/peptidylarginine deiminase [Nonomuraea sp. NPDC050556]|uniref:agmatine/peptidylarginine deiminase n=1 Tax=Nonomuraea sp. NPDC050556 TaxID=3364369 RepID=UPI0037B049B7